MKLYTLTKLSKALDKAGIIHEIREHPAYKIISQLPQSPNKIESNICGKHQIIITRKENRISIIRGALVSNGRYEVYNGEVMRLDRIPEVIKYVKEIIK